MTDKPTPTDAATPECLTCSDHGAVGNSGFDHKTAADLLNNKTVSDEAVRKFVAVSRWAHDERASLSATLLAMHGVLVSREAEIALLKKALLEAEAAPQQEAQEPVARYTIEDVRKARGEGYRNGVESSMPSKITKEMRHAFREKYKEGSIWTDRLDIALEGMLAAAPQPAPAPLSEMPYEKRKAIQEGAQISASDAWFHARHEMLDTIDRRNVFRAGFDRGWDAALAAQGDTP